MSEFQKLVDIVKRLRDPEGGCPWDIKQTHDSLKPYVLEEAYEVVEAIDEGPAALKKELGDLLLQVLMHSEIAAESGHFTLEEVLQSLNHKLISRHPHVFSDTVAKDIDTVMKNWESIKKEERDRESKPNGEKSSVLDGVPKGMPSLIRAQRMGEKAQSVGFDWEKAEAVYMKIAEEAKELEQALEAGNANQIEEEIGDLLFSIAQLSRKLELNSEDILHKAINKFATRFRKMEASTTKPLDSLDADKLESLWKQIKEGK